MASDKTDARLPVRFVQGTAVRVGAPWLKTSRAVARSRAGIRLVASNAPAPVTAPEPKDEAKD